MAEQNENANDMVSGTSKNDTLSANESHMVMGRSGDDRINGSAGNDILIGDGSTSHVADLNNLVIRSDYAGKVTFLNESAGYKNTLGMYKIGADGTIKDVQVLFQNASLKGSGGDLVSGESSVDLKLAAGDRLAFFVVPNAFSQNANRDVFGAEGGHYEFRDAEGNPGNINSGKPLELVFVNADGKAQVVKGQYGSDTFHSTDGDNGNVNMDGITHVVGELDRTTGKLVVGFEDLKGGGDKDYDDSVFVLDIGVKNALLQSSPEKVASTVSNNDDLRGGKGDDMLFGMAGDDSLRGGAGNDELWGNSGADVLRGGQGNDWLYGGSGDDVLVGQAGDDHLYGNSGNDKLNGGQGNDVLFGESGDDRLNGGAGDDKLDGGSGNDRLNGGKGDDALSGGDGDDVLNGGDGNDKMSGGSGNDRMVDGNGDDDVDGGSGDDMFIAGNGNDTYVGGSGFDTLNLSRMKSGANVDLHGKTVTVGEDKNSVDGIEAVKGTRFDDTFLGDKRDNVFEGGNGNDTFRGKEGADTFTGGRGVDTYQWFAKDIVDSKGNHMGVDRITDFSTRQDKLDFSELLKGHKVADIADFVHAQAGKDGTMLSVDLGGENGFVDVVFLQGVHDVDVHVLFDTGSLLG